LGKIWDQAFLKGFGNLTLGEGFKVGLLGDLWIGGFYWFGIFGGWFGREEPN